MYDPLFASETIGSKRFRAKAKREVAFLTKILKLPKEAKLLDVPCGIGRHSVLLGEKGSQVVGVDINRGNLKTARQKNRHPNVQYVWGNLTDLKKHRGQFDAVLNLFTSFGYFSTDQKNESRVFTFLSTKRKKGIQCRPITIVFDFTTKRR